MNIFLSYAAQDRKIAFYLASQLKEAGFSVWNPEEHIFPGDNFARMIGDALEKADAMIVLLSPDAVASPLVREEINYALVAPKFANRLIPVVVRPTEVAPWILRTMSVVRVGKNRAQAVRRIVNQLQRQPA